jgi:hypothetical protein
VKLASPIFWIFQKIRCSLNYTLTNGAGEARRADPRIQEARTRFSGKNFQKFRCGSICEFQPWLPLSAQDQFKPPAFAGVEIGGACPTAA